MYKSKKTAAFLLSALMIATFLFSLLFIFAESEHNCNEKNDCQICAQIKSCLHIFNENFPKPDAYAVEINIAFAVVLCIGFAIFAKKLNTPINLKVKLSN